MARTEGVEVPESQTVAGTLAANVRAFRQLRGMEQDKLAQRMQSLGHLWRQATVSEVERGRRNVTVPELVALTLALAANVEQLLDPRGPERKRGPRLALAEPRVEIFVSNAPTAPEWLDLAKPPPKIVAREPEQGPSIAAADVGAAREPEQGPSIAAADVGALVCSHETYAEVEWDSDRHFLRGIDLVHGDPPLIGDVGPDGTRS
jgi:transcriptional regulator with XRE-family HTH domain